MGAEVCKDKAPRAFRLWVLRKEKTILCKIRLMVSNCWRYIARASWLSRHGRRLRVVSLKFNRLMRFPAWLIPQMEVVRNRALRKGIGCGPGLGFASFLRGVPRNALVRLFAVGDFDISFGSLPGRDSRAVQFQHECCRWIGFGETCCCRAYRCVVKPPANQVAGIRSFEGADYLPHRAARNRADGGVGGFPWRTKEVSFAVSLTVSGEGLMANPRHSLSKPA